MGRRGAACTIGAGPGPVAAKRSDNRRCDSSRRLNRRRAGRGGDASRAWTARRRPFAISDRQTAQVTTIAKGRERLGSRAWADEAVALVNGEDAVSRVFLDVIQRELVSTLRETLRPHARLAASV